MTKVKSSKIISLIVALVLAFSSISLSVYAVTDSEKAEYNKKIEEIREQIAENKKKRRYCINTCVSIWCGHGDSNPNAGSTRT